METTTPQPSQRTLRSARLRELGEAIMAGGAASPDLALNTRPTGDRRLFVVGLLT